MDTTDETPTNSEADFNCDVTDDDDLIEYDPELSVTEEEKKAFEYMLSQKRDELVQQKGEFEKWSNDMTRRRMFALTKMRKFEKYHSERMKFYDKVEEYVKEVEQLTAEEDEIVKSASGDDTKLIPEKS